MKMIGCTYKNNCKKLEIYEIIIQVLLLLNHLQRLGEKNKFPCNLEYVLIWVVNDLK